MNIQRIKNDLKYLVECQALEQMNRSLTDGPCVEAKNRKILPVRSIDELTDEKVELYVNRMKETILKEREKATRQALANRRTDTKTKGTKTNSRIEIIIGSRK